MESSAEIADRLVHIRTALLEAGAIGLDQRPTSVTFDGGMFRLASLTWNPFGNVLTPVSHGRISLTRGSPGAIRFTFWLYELLAISTVMAVGALIVGAITTGLTAGLAAGFAAWAFFFGCNYLIARFRLHRFARDSI